MLFVPKRKTTMFVGIFLKFLLSVMIGVLIDICSNYMKCCKYLVLFKRHEFILIW